MIFTSMPDLPPRPLTAANAAFRERFYRRWGHENALVCGRSRAASYPPHQQTLSVKAAWGGRERYYLPEREVIVDDDHWMVLNDGRTYGSELRATRPMTSFAIFFRPGLAQEVAASLRQKVAWQLEAPDRTSAALEFSEHLRPHGDAVSRRLRSMHDEAMAGECSEDWLENQALLLAGELLGLAVPRSTACRGSRDELLRRLRLAADYIDSSHDQDIELADMARVACLSRFHFVRHFRAQLGITPYAYLLRKRATAARRMLAQGATDRESVALQCGFGSRFALGRALARYPASC